MSKILRVIFNVLLILVIIILSIYVILKFTNVIGIYKVMTGSMESSIHVGDYIVVKKCNNYKIGDVVTYKKDDYYITHRIIKMDNDKVITKGDANNTEDEEIDKSDIVGKYIFKHNVINFIIDYRFLLIISTILLYIIWGLIYKEKVI